MKILIEDLFVSFPYTLVYNEQLEYMTTLKRALDSQGHALIEMPTGTGKTICLLALLTSYLSHRTKYKKVLAECYPAHILYSYCRRNGENSQLN